jgi:hypothetical protein
MVERISDSGEISRRKVKVLKFEAPSLVLRPVSPRLSEVRTAKCRITLRLVALGTVWSIHQRALTLLQTVLYPIIKDIITHRMQNATNPAVMLMTRPPQPGDALSSPPLPPPWCQVAPIRTHFAFNWNDRWADTEAAWLQGSAFGYGRVQPSRHGTYCIATVAKKRKVSPCHELLIYQIQRYSSSKCLT